MKMIPISEDYIKKAIDTEPQFSVDSSSVFKKVESFCSGRRNDTMCLR